VLCIAGAGKGGELFFLNIWSRFIIYQNRINCGHREWSSLRKEDKNFSAGRAGDFGDSGRSREYRIEQGYMKKRDENEIVDICV
jgi:hypothetical protein